MDFIISVFNINNIFFTVLGYQMSYLEFFGTLFNLWCVWLVTKNKILSWPVGIVGSALFLILFYQIQLYSDLSEQMFYILTGFWGWWLWLHPKSKKEEDRFNQLKVSINPKSINLIYILIIIIATMGLTHFMSNIHLYLPKFFPEPASYPFLDAFTTVTSFVAQILLAKRKVESWYLWILVDIIGIGLYFIKGVVFISLLYFIFLILATKGLLNWRKIFLSQKVL